MKPMFAVALVLGCLLAATPRLLAQAQDSNRSSGPNQSNAPSPNKPAANSQNSPSSQAPARVNTQTNANPFPEDTSSVPVIPINPSDLPPAVDDEAGRIPLPPADLDPVRSPEEAGAAAEEQEKSSSSSLAGMSDLLGGPDDETQPGKKRKGGPEVAPEHHESAKEDENVGNYYLDNKDWKGALSRFESALVLDPDNPDVYWGLAECQRHLGNFADARANYQKVMEYDPGSHHAKEARKALEDPEIANAKPASSVQPAAQPQQ